MSDAASPVASGLARAAADRLAQDDAWLTGPDEVDDPSLYHGRAGVALALHEAHVGLGEVRYGEARDRNLDALARDVDRVEDCSLYFGLTGMAFALRSLGHDDAAGRALSRVRERQVRGRWGDMFELLAGNAGIALGALAAGDADLAVAAVTPYLRAADRTPGGVNWQVRPSPARSHHLAHGTLGIVAALAAVGEATARDDLVEMALAGAADVASRDEAGPAGFLVPHSDPPHRPDVVERYSYGWCNGPAGDAQVFRLLARVTGDPLWLDLQRRCWRTVVESGLPARLRPGFWDNSGRCCGTAGVLALACDRIVEDGDDAAFADQLVADMGSRATRDGAGVVWSNIEHRASPSRLPPRRGWAMGSAGILRELTRYARIRNGGPGRYGIQMPDHPAVRTGD